MQEFFRFGSSNLSSFGAGARVLFASDESQSSAESVLDDETPPFPPDGDDDANINGWQSSVQGSCNWCVIQLAQRGNVMGFELNAPSFSVEDPLSYLPFRVSIADVSPSIGEDPNDDSYLFTWMPGATSRLVKGSRYLQGSRKSPKSVAQAEDACQKMKWTPIFPSPTFMPAGMEKGSYLFCLPENAREVPPQATHVRLDVPSGCGIARLRVWGTPAPLLKNPTENTNTKKLHSRKRRLTTPFPAPCVELSSVLNGGRSLACSDQHYGIPSNLIRPYPGVDVGDGWMTSRHQNRLPLIFPFHPKCPFSIDAALTHWTVLKLGLMAMEGVNRIVLDGRHFVGNMPESVMVQGCFCESDVGDDDVIWPSSSKDEFTGRWFTLLPRTLLGDEAFHVFDRHVGQIRNGRRPVSHVKINIFPDGGLSRVRIYGTATWRDHGKIHAPIQSRL